MVRNTFRKLLAFIGVGTPVASPAGSVKSIRIHRDTSIPRTSHHRPSGRMRIFRSYKTGHAY